MQSPITDRKVLLRVAAATLRQLTEGAAVETESVGESPEDLAARNLATSALEAALGWAELDKEGLNDGTLESVGGRNADIPYLPSNQTLSLLQSAYDEYIEEQSEGGLETPFDTTDPGWITVVGEKLKALFRGKRKFIPHTSLTDFQHTLPEDAVVALVADWGTGEPTAKRVMQQIRDTHPTHVIHLGDVYYSGTPKEIQKRFLDVIAAFGPPRDGCQYFALNANHEMYSGGYGYFDTTLPAFGQPASYFSLSNSDWQLIGLDSGHEDHGLRDPQREWLTAQLDRVGPRNILLTHHQLFSPYEARASDKPLFQKTADLLSKVYAWFWGHEHKCIILGDHLGIKARCIGHGAVPSSVPYGEPAFPQVPVLRVDERESPEGTNVHGFALLRFHGPRLDVQYIDEFGTVFFEERLDGGAVLPGPRLESMTGGPDRAAHFKRQLLRRETLGGDDGLESMDGGAAEPDLSAAAIRDRAEGAGGELHEIVKKHLGDRPDLHELVDQIVAEGKESLEMLGRDEFDPDGSSEGLEVIVRADGSRPSFMVRNGTVDTTTSPVGAWVDQIAASTASGMLQAGIACVGRIDVPGSAQGFEGTGFLIAENLIVTNRHVLQAVARPNLQGAWTFKPGVTIDFGHEFRAVESITPRKLLRVVFCPARPIGNPVDHTKLDLVLIEIEKVTERAALAFDLAPDWAMPGQFIYTVGYPGNPGLGEPLTLLEQLFQSTFGCKRLAPGEILTPNAAVFDWTTAHDASTLGGNSGSVVLVAGREKAAAGLHYGGTRATPRENWGHVLGRVLAAPDKVSGKSLREVLGAFAVQLVDRTQS